MILTYHHIGDEIGENWVSVRSFADQMAMLANKKAVHITEYDENNPNHVVITFDDGYTDIKNALPILKKHGYPFSVFIVGDWFGTPGFIGAKDVREILKSGGRLQWHTRTHKNLTELSTDEIKKEIDVPAHIRNLDDNGFDAIAYPFWAYNDAVINAVREKFIVGRAGNGFAKQGRFSLDSIKVKNHTWLESRIVKFIEFIVPSWPCNFRCHYCYIGQYMSDEQRAKIEPFQYTPEQFAISVNKDRLGGTCIFNFCAHGETLLGHQTLEYIKTALESGHFVMIVSNMSITPRIDEILTWPKDLLTRLFFKCSFHYMELKAKNLLDVFQENVNKVWRAGCSATVEITPSDELVPFIDEIKEFSIKHFGALPHITVARDELKTEIDRLTKYNPDEYEKIWSVFDSDLFRFKTRIWGQKRKEFCYAGDWGYSINLASGAMGRCTGGGYVGNFYSELVLSRSAACTKCPSPHCYNGHVWLGLGVMPDLPGVTYAQMRDRNRDDGSHWLTADWRDVFSQKLYDNNTRYNPAQEKEMDDRAHCRRRRHSFWWHLRHMKF